MYRALSAAVVFSTLICFVKLGGVSLPYLIDLPSLLFLVGIVFGGLTFSFGPIVAARVFFPVRLRQFYEDSSQRELFKQALRRSSQLSYAAAVLGLLLGTITILANLSDPAQIGAGLAVALICPLYSVLLSVFLFDASRATIESALETH